MAPPPGSTPNPKTLPREAGLPAILVLRPVGIFFPGVRAPPIRVRGVDGFPRVLTPLSAAVSPPGGGAAAGRARPRAPLAGSVAGGVGGRGASVGLYAVAGPVFAAIAPLNFA